ncbi:MAG: TIGR00730 family Rossman fold protein [Marinilabiliales bacterium]
MNIYQSICVFCSSSDAISNDYKKSAFELGCKLAERNIKLIYGGGKIGLMGEVSKAVFQNNGYIIGVIPKALHRDGIFYKNANEMIITDSMHERKKVMRDLSDAFIALPGGFGTIEETLEIITLKQLRYHKKPIVIFNQNGFYDFLLKQFAVLFKENFTKNGYSSLYYEAKKIDDIFIYLNNYRYQITEDKWFS